MFENYVGISHHLKNKPDVKKVKSLQNTIHDVGICLPPLVNTRETAARSSIPILSDHTRAAST